MRIVTMACAAENYDCLSLVTDQILKLFEEAQDRLPEHYHMEL